MNIIDRTGLAILLLFAAGFTIMSAAVAAPEENCSATHAKCG